MAFNGIYTAIITPFDDSGKLALAAFRKIIEGQIKAGVAGIVVCGTTGESPALDEDEKKNVVRAAMDVAKGTPFQVLVGTGNNNTPSSIRFSKWASDEGAAALLVVTPYYSKPTQLGLRQHFLAIADEISCPMVLYNVPGRTGVSLNPETVAQLAQHKRIVGLKDATGNLVYLASVLDALARVEQDFCLLSGDDATFLPFMAAGGHGAISVASNIIPAEMVALYEAAVANDYENARRINGTYYSLFRDLFIESNPGPIKHAMALVGMCTAMLRAPLAELTPESASRLRTTLAELRIADVHA
jgi:4-hydroxy-tetrahydrodipicolinate synthase